MSEIPALPTPPGSMTVRGHLFAPVYMGDQVGVVRLSQREQQFVGRFLESLNLSAACNEVGISAQAGRGYLARKNVRQFIEDQLRVKALHSGTSVEYVVARFREAFDGTATMTPVQIEAGKVLARILRPASASGGPTVNVQVNVGESRFKDATVEVLADAMQERLNAVRGEHAQ